MCQVKEVNMGHHGHMNLRFLNTIFFYKSAISLFINKNV